MSCSAKSSALWRRSAAAFAFGVALTLSAAAGADDLCDRLFVPDGTGLDCDEQPAPDDAAASAIVRPEDGIFAPLSGLTVHQLKRKVTEPQEWMREQLTFNLAGLQAVARSLIAGDDSPFAGTGVADALIGFVGRVEEFGALPLESCSEPAADDDGDYEMTCGYELGPLRLDVVQRLLTRPEGDYAIMLYSMNDKRLQHLLAIANSFDRI